MSEELINLKNNIKNMKYPLQQILAISDLQQKDVIILTCGPSLNNYTQYLETIDPKKFWIIGAKQTHLIIPNMPGFFTTNLSIKSDYKMKPDQILINVSQSHKPNADINLKIINASGRNSSCIPNMLISDPKQNIFTIHGMDSVSWGDTMYESQLLLARFLKPKNIYIIGWDLSQLITNNKHFYNKIAQYKSQINLKNVEKQRITQIIKSTSNLNKHFKNKYNIQLHIVDPLQYKCCVHSSIPRITKEDFLQIIKINK